MEENSNPCKFPMEKAFGEYQIGVTNLFNMNHMNTYRVEKTSYNDLPAEIWKKILCYLPMKDQCEIRQVSKFMKAMMDDKYIHKFTLKITDKNVKTIRDYIEKDKIGQFMFKRMHLKDINCINDIEFILEKMAGNVEEITLQNTAVFESFNKNNFKYLKSLRLYCDMVLYQNAHNFNICELPPLEHLEILMRNYQCSVIVESLLDRLLMKPAKIKSLKHLKLDCFETIEYHVINLLMINSKIEHLDLCMIEDMEDQNVWEPVLKRLTNLKTFCFKSCRSDNWIYFLFTTLPIEAPLQHIEIHGRTYKLIDGFVSLIVHKWKDSIRAIKLSNCNFLTDKGLTELKKLTKLSVLDISPLSGVSLRGFLSTIAIKPNKIMEELSFSRLPALDELSLSVIPFRMPNLLILKLTCLPKVITNNVLAQIFRFQTRLHILHLDMCTEITDEGLVGFGNNPYSIKRLQCLEELNLINCFKLTDRTLTEALILPSLRKLDLKMYNHITIKGIKNLVINCPRIESLAVQDKIISDDNVIPVIGHGLKHLRLLRFYFSIANDREEEVHVDNNVRILQEGYSLQVEQL